MKHISALILHSFPMIKSLDLAFSPLMNFRIYIWDYLPFKPISHLTMICYHQNLIRRALGGETVQNWSPRSQKSIRTPQIAAMASKISSRQLNRQNTRITRGNGRENEVREGYLKQQPDELVNRSWSDQPLGQWSTWFDFFHFVRFLVSWSFPYHFQLKSPIFYAQCQGNFYFWSKLPI